MDQLATDHQKQISETSLEINERFQENNRDIEKYLAQQVTALKEQLAQERQKMDTIQEGKNQAYTVEAEKRILNKVTTILDENSAFKGEVFAKLEQQVNDTRKMYRETKEERMVFDTKLTTRLAEVRDWATKLNEEHYEEVTRLIDAKLVESEGKHAGGGLKHGAKGSQNLEGGGTLKSEILQILEDDRRLKNMRFDEVYGLIETNKHMQTELINQQFESQKALVKAIINKEVAERTAADEDIQANLNRQMANFAQKSATTFDAMQHRQEELDAKIT